MSYSTLLIEKRENVQLITINRADKLNALNKDVINELSMAIDEVITDDSIQAAIITGSGPKAFVAGADISEFLELDTEGGRNLAARGQEMVFSKIENSPKPVIAAVNGFALGGGCELAMACHIRLASSNSKFGQPEVNLGLIPGYGGTQRLTHLIGKGKAMELMLTGNMIDAEDAYRLGLVNHVYSSEELLSKAFELCALISTKAPLAIRKLISLINSAAEGTQNGYAREVEAFGALFGTEDAKEGATAFLEKRKAAFKGR